MTWLATVAVVTACRLWWCGPSARSRLRSQPRPERDHGGPGPGWLIAAPPLAAILGFVAFGASGFAIGLSTSMATCCALWIAQRSRRARGRVEVADSVRSGCEQLASLLRTGYPPGRALQIASRDAPALAEASARGRVGGDVPSALRSAASRPGADGLIALADAWQIAERSGASMTDSVDAVAGRLDEHRAVARTVEAELAAPRLTGRVLGLLPLAGLALGYGFGGDPLSYLASSVPGQLCLIVGAIFAVAGVVWSERLADRAGG